MHALLCGLQKDLLSLQTPLSIKSWKCLEASVDINANRSKKISGKVPLISTSALILWVDVCGQMLLFLQSLSEGREGAHRVVSQLFAPSFLLDRVLVWGFERQLNDFSLHVHQFSAGTVIH